MGTQVHRPLRTLCLALVATSLTVPFAHASANPVLPLASDPATRDPAVEAMISEADGKVAVSEQPATGKAGFVRVARGGDLAPEDDARPTAKAETWINENAEAFGASAQDLTRTATTNTGFGSTVTFAQDYEGIPVFGAELKVNFDSDGSLTSANGFVAPDVAIDTSPTINASKAAAKAVAEVRADPPTGDDGETDVRNIHSTTPELVIYRIGSVQGEPGPTELTWQVEVTNDRNVRDLVFISAVTGKPLNRYSLISDALDRRLLASNGVTELWKEGDAFPGNLQADQVRELDSTGDAYWFFKNAFGRDSYDGSGATMKLSNRSLNIPCPNASWDGLRTDFCTSIDSDDVVAHEWAHAYTQYTSGLVYQWQSGALNESYSDIWGETIDLINGREDAVEGDITATRAVGACVTSTPVNAVVRINGPVSLAKDCIAAVASYGPPPSTAGTSADVVAAQDAITGSPETALDGCSALTNAAEVSGRIALVDGGTCSSGTKTSNAYKAGAIGVIIARSPLAAPDPGTGLDPIPTVGISKVDGDAIRAALSTDAVNVSILDTNSHGPKRWQVGEQLKTLGPLRDMWTPTCFGDPGKVSDAEYFCGEDDAGGVHQNSGVPNHGYSLLVDGGTFNGVNVAGIGLDKSAAIYWLAQTRTTPLAGFSDHADLLAAACTDLVGQSVNSLAVAPNAAPTPAGTISVTNCQSVAAMIAAVELRAEPTQCNWTPQLTPGTPPVDDCGPGTISSPVFSEDFEDGLEAWTLGGSARWSGGVHTLWESSTKAPGGRAGTVAFAPDPDTGNCAGPNGSQTSTDWIESPSIELPTTGTPKLTFDHYVATETGWDGGLVQLSLNGGGWGTVPASAYLFNAPSRTLRSSATSDNPLAGQPAFTGLDGGKNGSWGTSQIDLALAGASTGDSVRVRFILGRDTCAGVDGWYVDNVSISACRNKVKLTAVHVKEPSTFFTASALKFTVTRDGSTGSLPSGSITFREGLNGAENVVTMTNGTATAPLYESLPVGTHRFYVTYEGNGTFASQTASVIATVAKVPSESRIMGMFDRPPHVNQPIKVSMQTRTKTWFVEGYVRLFVDKKLIAQRKLNGGVKVLKVKKHLKPGKHKFTMVYLGSSTVAPSKATVKIRVVR